MEIFRALGALIEPPGPQLAPLAEALDFGPLPSAAEHTDLLLLQLYPYASVYLSADGMLGGEPRDRVAGFWRALGRTPPAESDHLTVMLAFYAELCALGAEPARHKQALRARKAFLWEHLLSWLPVFLAKLELGAPSFYLRWGRLLSQALAGEVASVGRQDRLALHLRTAPAVADPRELGLDAFLGSLLSPVRSGIVLVRDDLGRAAGELGLGSRIGERKYVLKTLLGQRPTKVLGWLADEAAAWAERHRGQQELLGPAVGFWSARAEQTARLVGELGREPGG